MGREELGKMRRDELGTEVVRICTRMLSQFLGRYPPRCLARGVLVRRRCRGERSGERSVPSKQTLPGAA